MTEVVKVSISNTLQADFDYFSNEDDAILIGTRVLVPFRNSQRLGIISAIGKAQANTDKIKTIETVLDDEPIISQEILRLCQWVSQYYQAPLGEVLALAMPKKLRQGEKAELIRPDYFKLSHDLETTLNNLSNKALKQRELVNKLSQTPLTQKQITALGYSNHQIKTLEKNSLITRFKRKNTPPPCKKVNEDKLALNQEQAVAFDAIIQGLNHYSCFLLQGVTGSGKTEIYLQVIDKVLSKDKQVLFLVPEIGLTPQLVQRFKRRFNDTIVTLHSKLNDTERLQNWLLAREGIAKIIIGTRSAVFTQMPHLGLCIIDEEHDASLKQMESVHFSARETAMMRCHFNDIPIILGSATPSLESLYNAKQGKYKLLTLKQKAMNKHRTFYKLIDCRNKPLYHGITDELLSHIDRHLQLGNQVLVFLNRRGYSPVLMCHQCGYIKDCHKCDAHMTLHTIDNSMQCHHCGILKKVPKQCENCQSRELLPIGVGTQRVFDYLMSRFNHYKVLRIDKDETRKKYSLEEKLSEIESGNANLIIGTQMLAKGHHFPKLTLVAIIDIDSSLYSHDFRSLERMGQLVTQVSGRAGRASQPGEIIIQTHQPDNNELNLLLQKGYEYLANELLIQRQQTEFPPYSHLSLIRARAKTQKRVYHFLTNAKSLLQNQDIVILGPALAPLEKKGGYYRMQLLIKSKSRNILSQAMTKLRAQLHRQKITNGIIWSIDIDPQDMS